MLGIVVMVRNTLRQSSVYPASLKRSGSFGAARLRQEGFTLIELLIAMTLSLFLIGALILTFLSGRAAFVETEALSRTQENLRFASDFLIRDIRNAGFRDQLTLSWPQYVAVSECFASYGSVDCNVNITNGVDRSELVVRYAGSRACGLDLVGASGGLTMVENRYSVNAGGDLVCQGEEWGVDAGGELFLERDVEVRLATGLVSMDFDFIFPPDTNDPQNPGICNYLGQDNLESACSGVEVTITFAGPQPRTATLMAAFRNPILDRIYGRD